MRAFDQADGRAGVCSKVQADDPDALENREFVGSFGEEGINDGQRFLGT